MKRLFLNARGEVLVSLFFSLVVSCGDKSGEPRCGDGVVDNGEACDDGNTANGDSCESNCQLLCGNGVLDSAEECDDGNAVGGDGCDVGCALTCGSGTGASRATVDFQTGRCYAAYDGEVRSYSEAKAFCEGLGGHLPTITGAVENAAAFAAVGKGDTPWLGGNDIPAEGSFQWLTGITEAFSFTAFAAGEPNDDADTDALGDCLHFVDPQGQWGDTRCDNSASLVRGGLCEFELFPLVPSFPGDGLDLVVGDFNKDGNLDLVSGSSGVVDAGLVSLGDGTGAFVVGSSLGVANFGEVKLNDFNEDGEQDLVIAQGDFFVAGPDDTVRVLLGDGAGSFGPGLSLPTGGTPRHLATGDFNGDGTQDIATTNNITNEVRFLFGDGSGSFDPAIAFSAGFSFVLMEAEDFNEDNKLDLVLVNTFADSNNVALLLGDGVGSFGLPTIFTVGKQPSSVVVGDFNADNKQDLALIVVPPILSQQRSASVLLGDGAGSFGVPQVFPMGTQSNALVAEDFNADGNLDLAATNQSAVSVILGDGFGAFGAPLTFAAEPGSFGLAAGDFNRDGAQDLVTSANINFTNAGNIGVLLGDNTGAFAASGAFDAGDKPSFVVTGDFNGDNREDLAVTVLGGFDPDSVGILLGDGEGAFGPVALFPVGLDPVLPVVGDFNGDGHQDIATANLALSDISVLLGDGAGSFDPALTQPISGGVAAIAAVDFDEDGDLDLLVALSESSQVELLRNQGGLFESTTSFAVGEQPLFIVVGDFNSDSHFDFATANVTSSDVSIFLGDGISFLDTTATSPVGLFPSCVAVRDFNADNHQDLVTTNANSSDVSVLLGDGTGSFGAAVSFPVGLLPVSVAVGDFNADNHQDLVTANADSSNASVLLGDGTGAFHPATHFSMGRFPNAVVVGDFNQDGHPDLAGANFGSDNITLLLSPR